MVELINKAIHHPEKVIINLSKRGMLKWMSDETYLKIVYGLIFKKKLNLDNPQTFNEKLQWLKLYNRKSEYTTMVDKFAVKQWIADRVGQEYVIPTLGKWEHFDQIDFDSLPKQFVLKCTHDSGSAIIVRDKTCFDMAAARRKLERCLKQDYYLTWREWPYKNVPRRIICEKYLSDTEGDISECLTDYKVFCFGGIPKIIYVSKDHANEPKTDFFDENFNHLPIRMRDPNSSVLPRKPEMFQQMMRIAKILSVGIPHVRVDFYQVAGQLYVGELTFFHCSGFTQITPEEWSRKMGKWIELRELSENQG